MEAQTGAGGGGASLLLLPGPLVSIVQAKVPIFPGPSSSKLLFGTDSKYTVLPAVLKSSIHSNHPSSAEKSSLRVHRETDVLAFQDSGRAVYGIGGGGLFCSAWLGFLFVCFVWGGLTALVCGRTLQVQYTATPPVLGADKAKLSNQVQ